MGRKTLEMDPPASRRRGRPKRRFMDAVKEDMQVMGVTEEGAEGRPAVATPNGSSLKKIFKVMNNFSSRERKRVE